MATTPTQLRMAEASSLRRPKSAGARRPVADLFRPKPWFMSFKILSNSSKGPLIDLIRFLRTGLAHSRHP
jgi:hypothetical protein